MINYLELLSFISGDETNLALKNDGKNGVDKEVYDAVCEIGCKVRNEVCDKFHSLRKAFMIMDVDGSGSLTRDEFTKGIEGHNFTPEEVEEFIAAYPHHSRLGGFDYIEFCDMVHGQSPFGWTAKTREAYEQKRINFKI